MNKNNCCLSGDTQVLLKDGKLASIASLSGQNVSVFSGKEWVDDVRFEPSGAISESYTLTFDVRVWDSVNRYYQQVNVMAVTCGPKHLWKVVVSDDDYMPLNLSAEMVYINTGNIIDNLAFTFDSHNLTHGCFPTIYLKSITKNKEIEHSFTCNLPEYSNFAVDKGLLILT